MASKAEFVQYIADQLADAGSITYKKCLVNTEYIATEKYLH